MPAQSESDNVVVIRSPDFIEDLESVSAEGDLKKVAELFERSESMEQLETPQIDPECRPKYYEFDGALVAAAKHNHSAVVSFLLSKGLYRECTAIYAALENDSVEVLRCFLDNGWDPNTGLGHVGGPLQLVSYTPTIVSQLLTILQQRSRPQRHSIRTLPPRPWGIPEQALPYGTYATRDRSLVEFALYGRTVSIIRRRPSEFQRPAHPCAVMVS